MQSQPEATVVVDLGPLADTEFDFDCVAYHFEDTSIPGLSRGWLRIATTNTDLGLPVEGFEPCPAPNDQKVKSVVARWRHDATNYDALLAVSRASKDSAITKECARQLGLLAGKLGDLEQRTVIAMLRESVWRCLVTPERGNRDVYVIYIDNYMMYVSYFHGNM